MMKTSTFLLVLVAAIALVSGDENINQLRRGNNVDVVDMDNSVEEIPSDRRQLWSWFSMLFLLGPKMDCDHARPNGPLGHKWDHDCTSSTSTTTTTTITSESTYYDAETDTYVSSEAVEDSDQSSSGTNAKQNATLNSGSWWPLAVAGAAATVAIAAMVVGQRRGVVSNPKHPMQGSVARRKGAFENFADRALCDQSQGVEMVNSNDDYQLA